MFHTLLESKKKPEGGVKREIKSNKIIFTLKLILLITVIAYIVVFFYITISRINYPFSLEWMEGTSIIQVHRILSGQLLYVEPSLGYVSLIYPPVYYYVSAAFAKVIGLSFFSLRLVSLLSTLGCMALIFLIVRKIEPNFFSQIVAVGLFAAMFKIGNFWFDIARVDMLALFFALASIYFLHFTADRKYFFLSGLLLALSCMTKQIYLALLIAASLYCFFLDRKNTWIFIVSSVSVYSLGFLILNLVHDGWYQFFTFEVPYSHTESLRFEVAGRLLLDFILLPLSLNFLFTVFYFIQVIRDKKNYQRISIVFIVGAVTAISWMGIVNLGALSNAVIPAHAVLSIMTGIFLSKLLSDRNSPILFKAGALVLTVIQLALLQYPIAEQIPTDSDLRSGQALLQEIKNQPGDVYIPYHPELMLFADKNTYADWVSMAELQEFGDKTNSKEWDRVKSQLVSAFRKTKFTMIILDDDSSYGFYGQPKKYYPQIKKITYPGEGDFYPVSGWKIRPSTMYTLNNH